MANSAGICDSFKSEVLKGQHNFDVAGDSFKLSLYLTTATISPTTTAYTATGEVANSGTYAATGSAVTNQAPATTSTVGHWTPSANVAWSSVTFTTDCALLYNDTDAGKASVAAITFSPQTVTNGTFTLTMPTNDNTTGLIRLA